MSNFSDSALKVIKAVAPGIATALGGPLAGLAVSTLGKSIWGDTANDKTSDDIATAVLSGREDVLLAIKKAENDFQISLKALDVDLEKIAVGDRDSARKREVDSHDSATLQILSAVIIVSFLGMVYMVLGGFVNGLTDPVLVGIIGTLIGYVSAKADQVVSYYFGSSNGSARKSADIANVLRDK